MLDFAAGRDDGGGHDIAPVHDGRSAYHGNQAGRGFGFGKGDRQVVFPVFRDVGLRDCGLDPAQALTRRAFGFRQQRVGRVWQAGLDQRGDLRPESRNRNGTGGCRSDLFDFGLRSAECDDFGSRYELTCDDRSECRQRSQGQRFIDPVGCSDPRAIDKGQTGTTRIQVTTAVGCRPWPQAVRGERPGDECRRSILVEVRRFQPSNRDCVEPRLANGGNILSGQPVAFGKSSGCRPDGMGQDGAFGLSEGNGAEFHR